MAGKVDEILEKIPTLKIDLKDIINFDGQCIDPLAIEIITESLDYALQTSVRRLESVAKINPSIRDNATQTILPAIKTIRNIIKNAPDCPSSLLGAAPIKAPAPHKPAVKKEPEKAKASETIKPKKEPLAKSINKAEEISKENQKSDKDILAAQTDVVQKALKGIRLNNPDYYDDILYELRKGNPPTSALLAASAKKAETIEIGKQFTLDYADTSFKYTVVPANVAKREDQVPEEAGVIKLSEKSPLLKAVAGKKAGETAEIEVEGKKYTANIKDVKPGKMKLIEEPK
jgi:hypothetical protein